MINDSWTYSKIRNIDRVWTVFVFWIVFDAVFTTIFYNRLELVWLNDFCVCFSLENPCGGDGLRLR